MFTVNTKMISGHLFQQPQKDPKFLWFPMIIQSCFLSPLPPEATQARLLWSGTQKNAQTQGE